MIWRVRSLLPVAVAAALLVTTVACDDDPDSGAGRGRDELPASFPRDFPVPTDAVVVSTLVDATVHRSGATIAVTTDLVSAVQFFQVGLVNRGYVVNRSEGDADTWRIEFARGELYGVIDMEQSGGVTTALVTINAS
jgi:hypothetical protein